MRTATVKCAAVLLAILGFAVAPGASAQAWPAKPVRMVVSFPPGGGLDAFARIVAPKLQELLGQQMVVENRVGAGGMVGADYVAKAAPDGYTVLFASSAELTISQHLFPKMAYDPMKDLAPVSYASHAALLFSVHPSFPAKSLQEVIALTRAQPGKFSIASAGTGGVQHLAGELLKTAAKVDIVHIPYKGAGPAVIDMVGGQVQMGFTALPSSIQHARSGRLRPIAVTSVKRSEVAPELPTFTELGFPTVDLVVWYGVLFPAKTPSEIVARFSAEINRAVFSPEVKAKMLEQGIEPVGSTPDQLAKFMQSESARYGKVIKDTGAKPD